MKINYRQLAEESGVELKGMVTKGEKVTFLNLSKEDDTKVRIALELHKAKEEKGITNEDIMKKLEEMDKKNG